MTGIFHALTAALTAYSSWVRYQLETETDRLEDEIDRLAAIGDAASKLRIIRLSQRLKRKRESVGSLRPANGNADTQPAIPVPRGNTNG